MSLSKQAALAIAGAVGACIATATPLAAQSTPFAPTPNAPTPSTRAAPVLNGYRINPSDELEIYVWGEERLQRTVRVLPDGTFAFPLVGQVLAQGKLPQELEAAISERLRDQYRGQVPQVTVSVRTPAGLQFSVMGKVRSPGTFNPGRYATILDALSLAGGPAEFANLDSVTVIRKQGDRLVTLRFRLGALFKSGVGNADVESANIQRIEPGDTIIVP